MKEGREKKEHNYRNTEEDKCRNRRKKDKLFMLEKGTIHLLMERQIEQNRMNI